jgi:HNH endonuclease
MMSFEEFAQRMLLLLDEGRFVATYKFAVLLGLVDTLVESVGERGGAPGAISTRELAGKVIAIYWPQTKPVAGQLTLAPDHHQDDRLRQNQRGQAEIVSRIVRFRRDTLGDTTALLSEARVAHPAAFKSLERFVEWKLVEMPLGRLQLVGKSNEPFIYELGWREPVTQSVVQSDDFVGQLKLVPGAGDHLLRMSSLLRPLVQRTWALTVARWNGLEDAKLDGFLFGVDREALARVTPGLRALACGRCFYCDGVVESAQVDHFIPWARHPDNAIQNLVYAHGTCNNAKRAFIAAENHLERMLRRMTETESASGLKQLAADANWESRPQATLAITRSTYLTLPASYKLWERKSEFSQIDPARVRAILEHRITLP